MNLFKNFLILSIAAALSGCEHLCPPLPGAEPLLQPGQVVLLGEIHGTRESPEFAGQIACNALKKELMVTIALELPQADQEQLDEYLDSDGSSEAKRKFLGLNFWSRDYQDGRASQSIFQLIESVRKLRKNKQRIDVVFLDVEGSGERDRIMADRLLEDVRSYPNNFFIALTGNIHNIISEGSGRMGSHVVKELGKERVVSLKQNHSGGSAWLCLAGEGCGPVDLKGRGGNQFGIFLNDDSGNYDGTLEMDSIHVSLPARELISI